MAKILRVIATRRMDIRNRSLMLDRSPPGCHQLGDQIGLDIHSRIQVAPNVHLRLQETERSIGAS